MRVGGALPGAAGLQHHWPHMAVLMPCGSRARGGREAAEPIPDGI